MAEVLDESILNNSEDVVANSGDDAQSGEKIDLNEDQIAELLGDDDSEEKKDNEEENGNEKGEKNEEEVVEKENSEITKKPVADSLEMIDLPSEAENMVVESVEEIDEDVLLAVDDSAGYGGLDEGFDEDDEVLEPLQTTEDENSQSAAVVAVPPIVHLIDDDDDDDEDDDVVIAEMSSEMNVAEEVVVTTTTIEDDDDGEKKVEEKVEEQVIETENDEVLLESDEEIVEEEIIHLENGDGDGSGPSSSSSRKRTLDGTSNSPPAHKRKRHRQGYYDARQKAIEMITNIYGSWDATLSIPHLKTIKEMSLSHFRKVIETHKNVEKSLSKEIAKLRQELSIEKLGHAKTQDTLKKLTEDAHAMREEVKRLSIMITQPPTQKMLQDFFVKPHGGEMIVLGEEESSVIPPHRASGASGASQGGSGGSQMQRQQQQAVAIQRHDSIQSNLSSNSNNQIVVRRPGSQMNVGGGAAMPVRIPQQLPQQQQQQQLQLQPLQPQQQMQIQQRRISGHTGGHFVQQATAQHLYQNGTISHSSSTTIVRIPPSMPRAAPTAAVKWTPIPQPKVPMGHTWPVVSSPGRGQQPQPLIDSTKSNDNTIMLCIPLVPIANIISSGDSSRLPMVPKMFSSVAADPDLTVTINSTTKDFRENWQIGGKINYEYLGMLEKKTIQVFVQVSSLKFTGMSGKPNGEDGETIDWGISKAWPCKTKSHKFRVRFHQQQQLPLNDRITIIVVAKDSSTGAMQISQPAFINLE